jgi:hypothetical protein
VCIPSTSKAASALMPVSAGTYLEGREVYWACMLGD